MTAGDIPQVQQVAIKSWHTTYENIIPLNIQNNFLSKAYSEERLLARLSSSPFYVAKIDKQVIGFANFSNKKADGTVELFAVYLDPDFQGKGIGSALLQVGIEQLQPTQVFINVEAENRIGRQFYNAKGFQVIEKFNEVFDGHQLKNVRMSLNL